MINWTYYFIVSNQFSHLEKFLHYMIVPAFTESNQVNGFDEGVHILKWLGIKCVFVFSEIAILVLKQHFTIFAIQLNTTKYNFKIVK